MVKQQIIEPLGHNVVIDEAIAATCTKDGKTSGAHCSRCGEVIVTQNVINHVGHKVIVDAAVPATCTEHGLTEGSHCETCGEILVAQQIIEPLHHVISLDSDSAAHCARCGEELAVNNVGELDDSNYKLTIHDGGNTNVLLFKCGDPIEFTDKPDYEHTILGYYKDSGFTQSFTYKTMPQKDLDVYVKRCEHEWHKTTDSLYSVYCTKCGHVSLPTIKITSASEFSKEYVNTTVSVDSGFDYYDINNATCKVKIRGNSSSEYEKKPYRLKFDKKQMMLGLNDELKAKNWVLLAEWNGYSVKNMSAFEIAKQIYNGDYYSSDYCFVDLMINDNYEGVYLLAEQQQVNEGRVEINEPAKNYVETDIGYLIEMDSYAAQEDYYFGLDYGEGIDFENGNHVNNNQLTRWYTVKSDVYSDDQVNFIKKVTQNTYDVLRDSLYENHSDLLLHPYKTLDANYDIVDDALIQTAKEAVEKVIDYDSFMKTFIINEICEDADIGWSSFYMSFDASLPNQKLVFQAPWDFDLGFGYSNAYTYDGYLYNFSEDNAWHVYNPWLMMFSQSDWFIQDFIDAYKDLNVDRVILNTINSIESFASTRSVSLYDNYTRWPILGNFSTFEAFNTKYQTYVNKVSTFLFNKKTNLNDYIKNHKL